MARQYKLPKGERYVPFPIYLPAQEYQQTLAVMASYPFLNRSMLGRYAIKMYIELVRKHGLDPHTLRPVGT